jgi:hypothetical protein
VAEPVPVGSQLKPRMAAAVLGATNTGMVVNTHGSIDALEIRTHVRQVLEGGEEAFMRRYHKYGGMRLDLPTVR